MNDFSYSTIKSLAKENGLRIDDLLALAPNNDPFYTGRPSEVAAARWFADLWAQFGYSNGVHLRRIHYRIVSQEQPVLKPDGLPYENTERCWDYLNNASKWARYLRLVDPDAFVDKRNPEAAIHAWWDEWASPEPGYSVFGDWEGSIETDYSLPDLPELPGLPWRLPDLPSLEASGYIDVEQGYLVEVWAEKTTMNDVLDPLCSEYRMNLITGAGELSITAVRQFLRRAMQAERPARILYISDFDPAGLGMPISVARKIEFYQRNDGYDDLNIALQPIVLTAEQVRSYTLPRVPVKDTDLRKGNFEAAYGEGQVELDALEALYPGVLGDIVRNAILRYYDPALTDRARREKGRLQAELDRIRQAIRESHEAEIGELESEYKALLDDFEQTRQEFASLIQDFAPRIEAHQERLEKIKEQAQDVYSRLSDELDAANVDLEHYPLPDPDIGGDPDGLLYDSERDYLDQLEAYKLLRRGG